MPPLQEFPLVKPKLCWWTNTAMLLTIKTSKNLQSVALKACSDLSKRDEHEPGSLEMH